MPEPPAPTRFQMVGKMWECFHLVWGQATVGTYDKQAWIKLQAALWTLLRYVGLERRAKHRTDPPT